MALLSHKLMLRHVRSQGEQTFGRRAFWPIPEVEWPILL